MPGPAATKTMAAGKEVAPASTGAIRRLVPFVRAARQGIEPMDDRTFTLGTTTQTVSDIKVPPMGFLRSIVLDVSVTGGTATFTYTADAPYNMLSDITLVDANGRPIVGPISGYNLFLVDKWLGQSYDSNPANSPLFTTPTSGNFSFQLRVPVEVSERDGLGSLPNTNAMEAYRLSYTVNPTATVMAGGTGTIVARIRTHAEYWFPPAAVDALGSPQEQVPPAVNGVQTVTVSTPTIAAGEQRIRMTRTGGYIRMLLLVVREVATRSDTPVPDTIRLERDGQMLANMTSRLNRFYARERTAYAPDTGLVLFDFEHDLDGKIGYGMRDQWLPTTTATRLEVVGTFAGTTPTLQVITIDYQPPQGSDGAIFGG